MVIQRCCQWIHGDSMGISWKYNDLIGLNHQFDLILDENWLFLPFRLTTISELDLAVLHFFLVLLTLHPCVPLYPQRTITLDQCLRSNFLFIHNKNGRTPAIYGKDWDGLLAFFLHLFLDFLIAPPTPRTRRTRSTGSPAQHLPPSLAILISRPDTWPSSGWNMADLDHEKNSIYGWDFPKQQWMYHDMVSQCYLITCGHVVWWL